MKFKKNVTRVSFIDNEEEKLWYKAEQFSICQIKIQEKMTVITKIEDLITGDLEF